MNSQHIWLNTQKMFIRRGYLAKDFVYSDTLKEDELRDFSISSQGVLPQVSVFFVEEGRVNIQVFKQIMSNRLHDHIVIIHKHSMTPDTNKSIFGHKNNKPFFFESFTFEEMSYDLVEYVNPHALVSKEELLEWPSFRTDYAKLPIILQTDIVSRYYLFRPGDVISIEENGFISYRRCV